MIQLVSLLWVFAIFGAVIGFLRGWYRELVVTAGVVLSIFVLLQFDTLLRGLLLVSLSRDQVFILQSLLFAGLTMWSYRVRFGVRDRAREGLQAGILGAVAGGLNGYLIGSALWYFLDVNEYPFSTIISAPPLNSASAAAVETLPMVVLSGGVTGGGEFLVLIAFALFVLIIFAL